MLEYLTPNTLAEYESFLQHHPKGHFCQSVLWAKVKSEWTWEVVLVRREDGVLVGSLAVLIRRMPLMPYRLLYAPRGPVCHPGDTETLAALTEGVRGLAKRYNGFSFQMDPDVPASDAAFTDSLLRLGYTLQGEGKNFEGIQPRFVFRLPIAGRTEQELLAGFHEKWRYNIRLAARKGVTVQICGPERLQDFVRIMVETGLRDNFVTRPLPYFRRMMDSMGDRLRLYMAFYQGQPIAGALAIHYGDKVWYLYGASSNTHRNVMPNYLLQWEMIRWAAAEGCSLYDFRGVSGDLSEDNPLYGLYRFKKGFGGDLTEFPGAFELCFKPGVSRMVTLLRKCYNKAMSIRYRLQHRA